MNDIADEKNGDFYSLKHLKIIAVLSVIVFIAVHFQNYFMNFREGYVVVKYTVVDYETPRWIVTIYDKDPGMLSQDFRMSEFYVDKRFYDSVRVQTWIKVPEKFEPVERERIRLKSLN